MIHKELIFGGHYAVSLQHEGKGILLQVQDAMDHTQARVVLTIPEAIWLMEEISNYNGKLSEERAEALWL